MQKELHTRGRTLGRMAHSYDLVTALLGIGPGFRELTVRLAQVKPGDKVLDVGCGTGSLTIAAKRWAGQEGEVHGIDAAPEMIDVARHKAVQSGVDVDFRVGLIEDIPFPDEQFDVVLNSLMMHHLPDDLKREGFAEMHRVLKPSGHLLVVDFGPPTNPLSRVLAILFLSRVKEMRSNIRGELPVMMRDAGFAGGETVMTKYGILSFARGRK